MAAGTRQTDQHIAFRNFLSVQQVALINSAYAETGNIIMVDIVHIRHFRRFTADQRAFCLYAAVSHAFHDLFDHFRMIFSYCDIIQEKDWCRSLYEHIVNTHGNGIHTDRVMFVCLKGNHQLCADTIRTADKHRFFISIF